MRQLLAAATVGDEVATIARDVYVHRLRASIAAMAAAMGGLDVILFTGGVGENAPEIRERAASGLGFLGVRLDPALNAVAEPDAEIGAPGAPVSALVIRAREDLEIVREVRAVLGMPGAATQ
jgi:acetate kinase